MTGWVVVGWSEDPTVEELSECSMSLLGSFVGDEAINIKLGYMEKGKE